MIPHYRYIDLSPLINYYAYFNEFNFFKDLTALAQYWSGSTCTLYCSEEDFKYVSHENSICIMNHKYDVDWMMGWLICQKVGVLAVIDKNPIYIKYYVLNNF